MAPTRSRSRRQRLEDLTCVHPNAAGLDIGSEESVVAVPPGRDPQNVRVFRTFTPDVQALVAWLITCGIDTVVMESTGVFWVPIYELLERHGIRPYLVNARHIKTVPGRKSDWNDAQWLQKLHALELLRGSFRPDAEMVTLRTLARYRVELIERRAPHINHMQQVLKQVKIQLNVVLSDITGVIGLAILRAIVAGERDPARLAELRNPSCKATVEEITKALTGSWQEAPLFILQQALEIFDYYTAKVAVCDAELERVYQAMASRGEKNITGGKVLRSRTMKVHSRANQAFRDAAASVGRSDSAVGAYYRAMRARLGPQQAIVATAHKIARVVYHLLTTREAYQEEHAAEYEQKQRERELKHLQRRAQKLGYTLAPVPETVPESQLKVGG
jgi:hypothetical protein